MLTVHMPPHLSQEVHVDSPHATTLSQEVHVDSPHATTLSQEVHVDSPHATTLSQEVHVESTCHHLVRRYMLTVHMPPHLVRR